MACRALVVTALALAAAGAAPAQSDPAGAYVLARADPRLCPSPTCGGIWVRAVNVGTTACGDGLRRNECYAASADLTRLRVDADRRELLRRAIGEGRAVARGTLVHGRVAGFPELDTLAVSEVWTASSSRAQPAGAFRRLRDNGIRCVTAPCFWIGTATLNTARAGTVSSLDLSRTGATRGERRRAVRALSGGGLIAAGRVVRRPDRGRAVVATQVYLRAEG